MLMVHMNWFIYAVTVVVLLLIVIMIATIVSVLVFLYTARLKGRSR